MQYQHSKKKKFKEIKHMPGHIRITNLTKIPFQMHTLRSILDKMSNIYVSYSYINSPNSFMSRKLNAAYSFSNHATVIISGIA